MKRILIGMENSDHSFACPFCGRKNVINDGPFCEHVLFGYEEVNSRPVYMSAELYSYLQELLFMKRVNFLEGFQELWVFSYKPLDRRAQGPEDWDDAKEEAVNDYLENFFSMVDLKKVIRCSLAPKSLRELVYAETEEDPELGSTEYVLWESRKESGDTSP